MSTHNNSLTDLTQLDELNKEVWAITERNGEYSQRVKKWVLDHPFAPSQNTVIADEAFSSDQNSAAHSMTQPTLFQFLGKLV
jgi:hypothetical protein